MKLFLFADPHYGKSELKVKNRRPVLSLKKLASLTERMAECDAVVCLGDLTDDGEGCEVYLAEMKALIKSTGKPYLLLMGNHDCINFSQDEFYEKDELRPPYSVLCGRDRFVFLDANYLSCGEHYLYENVDWKDSCVPHDQIEMLKTLLDGATENDRVFVFVHQCLAPDSETRHRIKNYDELHALFVDSKAKVTVVQGHYHPGAECTADGIRYITLPAMCVEYDSPHLILDTDE